RGAARGVPVISPGDPTPGMVEITRAHLAAHAYDINLRMRDSGHVDLTTLMEVHEIDIPAELHASGPDLVAPPMEPILVKEDENVRVTAVLVAHPPVFPSFAFRFDTERGSVVFSGDTAPSPNLVALARDADVLVHEVFHAEGGRRVTRAVPKLGEHIDLDAMLGHILRSHTAVDEVGRVATEANVRTLVLTHFIPAQGVPDEDWLRGASAHFDGEVVVGHDLLQVGL
ncbi:MAG: MBL fold metallo-hydrolase, partial [Actinomycetota bacterium]|nr:MBL fold metallo-hydrolase [Actinomycetota bacterium]